MSGDARLASPVLKTFHFFSVLFVSFRDRRPLSAIVCLFAHLLYTIGCTLDATAALSSKANDYARQ